MEAAFFDLDKTVIASASMVAFGRRFYDAGMISRRTVLRGLWGQLVYLHLGASEEKLTRMRETVLALTRGWDQGKVSAIVEDALTSVVEPIIYAEALELMAEHRRAGRRIVIVSASPEEIVNPIGRLLDVDDVLASRSQLDHEGRYTGEMAFYAYGPFKADAMRDLAGRRGIDLAASFAYSDSYTDLPMLEAVGHPVAVNPDRPLAKAARDRGYEVRSFARPVRLRDRLPAHTGQATGVVAGVAALGLGAALWSRSARRVSSLAASSRPGLRGRRAGRG
ncbi:MAG TPA: HAD family hydrolase [Acidimicrobiales bacterium]|nr:HAD family hydrolase [Acidimicrobiales bacterium]